LVYAHLLDRARRGADDHLGRVLERPGCPLQIDPGRT
jgi:hypothetical protein